MVIQLNQLHLLFISCEYLSVTCFSLAAVQDERAVVSHPIDSVFHSYNIVLCLVMTSFLLWNGWSYNKIYFFTLYAEKPPVKDPGCPTTTAVK